MKTTATKSTPAKQPSTSSFFDSQKSEGHFFGENKGASDDFFPVQTKLSIGAPNDKYEREADATGDRVVKDLATQNSNQETKNPISPAPPTIQHKSADAETKEKEEKDMPVIQRKPIFESDTDSGEVQMKSLSYGKEESVQKKSDGSSIAGPEIQSQLSKSKGGGSSLPEDTRTSMESSMGADFSNVRVHTDSKAQQMSKNLGAQAFTHGNDIYFNAGKFDTQSSTGQKLLAHELTHTVQQGMSNPKDQVQFKLEDYEKPGHGENANNRLKAEVDGQKNSSSRENSGETDPISNEELLAEKNSKKNELSPTARPEVNESKIQVPKIKEEKKGVENKIDEKPKTEEKSKEKEVKIKPKNKKSSKTLQTKSKTSIAAAKAIPKPSSPNKIRQPEFFQPKDAEGENLPVNQEQFVQFVNLASQIQDIRDKGFSLLQLGTLQEQQSHLIEGQIQSARSVVAESDNNLELIDQGIESREQTHQEGISALSTAEQKQQTVETEIPRFVSELDKGKSESGEVVNESSSLNNENESNQPEDPEDRAKSQEMGGKIQEVSRSSTEIDQTFLSNQEKINQFSQKNIEAKQNNVNSRASLDQVNSKITQTKTKSDELKAANQQATSDIEAHGNEPLEVRTKAIGIKTQGQTMINESISLEERLHTSRDQFQQNLAGVPPQFKPENNSNDEDAGIIQRNPQGDYSSRIDVFEGSFLDPAFYQTEEERRRAQQAAEAANRTELNYISQRLPGNFSQYGYFERIGVGIGAKLNRFGNWISELGVAGVLGGVGSLLVSMLDPRTYIAGVAGGFTRIINGAINLGRDIYNLEGWGILKSLADIATGVAIIAGTITGLALVVELAMAALLVLSAIFTLGASAGFIVPVMLFAGKVMVVAGKIAFWAGAAAAALNLILGIKSLDDMGDSQSATELQAQTNDFTQDMGGVATGLLSMVVGKAGMGGTARIAGMINYSAGISQIASIYGASMAARVAARGIGRGLWNAITFRGLRSRISERFRRPNTPATQTDPGLANRGYRPQPGERSMTREQYRAQQSNARANRRIAAEDRATGGHTHERHSATKTNKWLQGRAAGHHTQPTGPAATRFVNPNVHVRTLELLRQRVRRAILDKLAGNPIPSNIQTPKNSKLLPGARATISREPMGYVTGQGYYSPNGAAQYGTTAGAPTGPLNRATAVFEYRGMDANGMPILRQVTCHPDLPPP